MLYLKISGEVIRYVTVCYPGVVTTPRRGSRTIPGKAHTTTHTSYSWSCFCSYSCSYSTPSVSHIASVAQDGNFNIVFAVKEEYREVYLALAR